MNKTNKKFFVVTVINEVFGQFTQEFFAASSRRARKAARTWFSLELGARPEDIEVLKAEEGRLTPLPDFGDKTHNFDMHSVEERLRDPFICLNP